MKKLPRTLGLAVGLLIACTLGGCTYDSLCAAEMECRHGNDGDVDACVIGYHENDDLADLYGCSDKWDQYVTCYEERAHCDNPSLRIWTGPSECGIEWNDYTQCVK